MVYFVYTTYKDGDLGDGLLSFYPHYFILSQNGRNHFGDHHQKQWHQLQIYDQGYGVTSEQFFPSAWRNWKHVPPDINWTRRCVLRISVEGEKMNQNWDHSDFLDREEVLLTHSQASFPTISEYATLRWLLRRNGSLTWKMPSKKPGTHGGRKVPPVSIRESRTRALMKFGDPFFQSAVWSSPWGGYAVLVTDIDSEVNLIPRNTWTFRVFGMESRSILRNGPSREPTGWKFLNMSCFHPIFADFQWFLYIETALVDPAASSWPTEERILGIYDGPPLTKEQVTALVQNGLIDIRPALWRFEQRASIKLAVPQRPKKIMAFCNW